MRRLLLALVLGSVPALVGAHEFWIDPLEYRVAQDAPLQAEIRIGQEFKGSASPYVPINFRRFELWQGDQMVPVEGRVGDRPALNMAVGGTGLVTVVYVTRDYALTYTGMEKFENFARHKDFMWAVADHDTRGLPKDKFKESYTRFGKSLMAVGDGAGADQNTGLEVELVALQNPYTDDVGDGMQVQLFYQGGTLPNAQVELFERAPDGSVEVRLYRTDGQGIATLDVSAGHAYLADHVVLRAVEPDAMPNGAVWESLWASLTFEVAQ